MKLSYRELYCPAHFGNSYEVAARFEMEDILREAKFWGFNAYGDWFDGADLKNPHNNPRNEYLMPQAIWERKLDSFSVAQSLGFETDLVITPNHVFLDQLKPELLAKTDDERFFGQLLCPSIPEARQVILDNYRWIFRDLKSAGVSLGSISGCPFDYGGCSCDACGPWMTTFGELFAEIHEIAKEFFGDVRARLIGWWWTRDEHSVFKAWADQVTPKRFRSLAAHLPYGVTCPNKDIALPDGCELHAFVHIGYADEAEARDRYGTWGPVAAPGRLAETTANLSKCCTGLVAYSEGVFDDVNKALCAGLASGVFPDAESVLETYAERYFGAKGAERHNWAEWLMQWGESFLVDTAAAHNDFELLSKSTRPSWRLAQWEAKLRMFEAHTKVLHYEEWNKARLVVANSFLSERDRLYREIWKLGLVRHALNPRYFQPEWYADMPNSREQGSVVSGEV